MDKNELESKKLPELKDLAIALGIEGAEAMKKEEIVEKLTEDSEDDKPKRKRTRKKVMTDTPTEENDVVKKEKDVIDEAPQVGLSRERLGLQVKTEG